MFETELMKSVFECTVMDCLVRDVVEDIAMSTPRAFAQRASDEDCLEKHGVAGDGYLDVAV